MKFSEMPYARPELEPTKAEYAALIAAFEAADTPEAAFAAYKNLDDFQSRLGTMYCIAYVRHTQDTTDEYYDAEQAYFDEALPLLRELDQRLSRALLESPHRPALEAEFGTLMFRNIEIQLKTFSPEIVPELQQENRLTTEYAKLIASAQIDFDGKTLTLAQITPYLQNPDAAVRRAAGDARNAWFSAQAAAFDDLFDQLVQVRTQMARKLGYENYIELGYYNMTRNCYDKEMVAKFREGVRKYIVPIAARLKGEQAERIGVPKITLYDDAFEFPTGNPKPVGTPEDIFAHGQKMYHELSPETGEFIDFMLENELFDVLTRPGKAAGGYCIGLSAHKSEFIFANFNGTSGDIDVLTHEAGHAFAGYTGRDIYPAPLREYTYETAEVHSMSMEFFTWPWMEGFFGPDTAKYRYSHLFGALTFLPYGTMVDHFQHEVYARPEMTPGERNALWRELEGVYRPWLDLSEPSFFREGRRWQYQTHIYERPFYYIDYCLAQTMALAFWAEDRHDHESAWRRYMAFLRTMGKKTFLDTVEAVGLPSPFVPETLQALAGEAAAWLDGQPRFQ